MTNTTNRRQNSGVGVMAYNGGSNNRNNYTNTDTTGEIISWVIVFVCMFAFPPAGLILLLRKLHNYAKPRQSTFTRQNNQTQTNYQYNAQQTQYTSNQSGQYKTPAGQYTTQQTQQQATQQSQQQQATQQNAQYYAQYSQAGTAPQNTQRAAPYNAQYSPVQQNAQQNAHQNATQSAQQNAPYTATHTTYISPQKTATGAGSSYYQAAVSKSDKKKKESPLDKKSGKFIAALLFLISIALFILGAAGVANGVQSILSSDLAGWYWLIMGGFSIVGGAITFGSRNVGVKRIARYKKYYAIVDGRGITPIPDIVKATGLSVKVVVRDLQEMINDGYFGPGVYIDSELDSLVLFPEAAKATRAAAKSNAASQDAAHQAPDIPENQYMAIIHELRELNETILDIPISDKIDRIEGLTAKIFRIVEENPEKLPQIRRFMNYYLPTTLKLLRSYATLEKQGIMGENITAAKENIGRILDTLATGYEQQLDQLFKADAIDIAADINVLENLMQQDGLTGDKQEFKVEAQGM